MQINHLPAIGGFTTTGQIRIVLYQSGQIVHAPVDGLGLALSADLATVATSGDYDDLSNTPSLGTAAAADTTDFATAAQGAKADSAVQPGDLGDLAAKDTVSLTADVTGILPGANLPDDLTADKAFRRGNVLGAVSQSAGVPTGALIEQGSNANGFYARFADGTQICWFDESHGFSLSMTSLVVDPIYRSTNADTLNWTFPASFADQPVGNVQGNTFSIVGYVTGTSNGGMACRAMSLAGSQSSKPISACAVGRWY